MGIMFVLMAYAVVLLVAASIASALFASFSYAALRRAHNRRKRVVLASAAFPFGCVLFAAAWFLSYATVNSVFFHRDPGLGDTWQTPLPNGYALLMIDVTDEGTIYKPRTQSGDGSVVSRDDSVFGVRQLQVSKSIIYGARDSGYFERLGKDSQFVDHYFELDTTRNKITDFTSLDDLRRRASSEGAVLNLRPFERVFGEYRTTWFDYAGGVVLIMVPLVAFMLLSRWVWMIRKSSLQYAT